MASIRMENLVKVYPGDVTAVKDFNLQVEDGEFVILVGPSGCGKSTMLRMVAGLEEITEGELYIGDKLMNDVAPKDRDIAMVFQTYALYPHMTVYKNMAFSLQLQKVSEEEIDRKVKEAADILDIAHLLNRKPAALSGGQRQRVALGRAMVRDPAVFLLDEPLSNLDAKLRTTMRSEIIKLHKRLQKTGTTFVYVTHDQVEAMTMADRIAVMDAGVLQQVDTPQTLYNKPINKFVAGFIGSPPMNFFEGTVERDGDGFAAVNGELSIHLPPSSASKTTLEKYLGKEVYIGVRPENLHYEPAFSDVDTATMIDVKVELAEMMGSEIFLYGKYKDTEVVAKLPARHELADGEVVTLAIDGNRLHLFDKETEKRLD